MTSPPTVTQLTVQVDAGPGATPDEVDSLTRQLLRELQDMPIESAELAAGGAVPAGAKSAEAITSGAIALAVLPNLLPRLIEFVQAWALRGQSRTVKFKGKIGGQAVEFEGSGDDLKALLASLAPRPAPARPDSAETAA